MENRLAKASILISLSGLYFCAVFLFCRHFERRYTGGSTTRQADVVEKRLSVGKRVTLWPQVPKSLSQGKVGIEIPTGLPNACTRFTISKAAALKNCLTIYE